MQPERKSELWSRLVTAALVFMQSAVLAYFAAKGMEPPVWLMAGFGLLTASDAYSSKGYSESRGKVKAARAIAEAAVPPSKPEA